jgi:protein tyrosine/serine phosphatase
MLGNFRDISQFNSNIQEAKIFRSSSPSLVEDKKELKKFLQQNRVETIIDLRADREIAEEDYRKYLSDFEIIHAPFDPWSQSLEFQNMHGNSGTNIEIAYKFFSLECKSSFKKVFQTVANSENSILIHCYAGKDRTGIVISAIHLLLNAERKSIYNDYLQSEMDTKEEYLDIFLNIVEKEGGIYKYLESCEISKNEIEKVISRLKN